MGVKKRDFRSAQATHPTKSQWKAALSQPGGFNAHLAHPYEWFDAHQPDKTPTTPFELVDTTDDEHTKDDDDTSSTDDSVKCSVCGGTSPNPLTCTEDSA